MGVPSICDILNYFYVYLAPVCTRFKMSMMVFDDVIILIGSDAISAISVSPVSFMSHSRVVDEFFVTSVQLQISTHVLPLDSNGVIA